MTTPRNDILFGDVREVMRGLDDGSVNCIITSPPYWSLRKYDIPDVVWDGVEGCEHEWGDIMPDHHPGQVEQTKWKNADAAGHGQTSGSGQFCFYCGSWRGQLGLEPTIALYLSHLMQVMDECKRVLRDDGTMWVNIGDSYSGSGGAGGDYNKGGLREGQPKYKQVKPNLPPKSLCLIPERFSIEMVNRGWILRNKIVWSKPNCMPSSVKDRFTVDWEPVYFFVKSKKYWFEQQYEPRLESSRKRYEYGLEGCQTPGTAYPNEKRESPFTWKENPNSRNRRCVWSIPTQPYPESHFATFPEALVEPMILAGCPKEICKQCGMPRSNIRVVTSHYTKREKAHVPNNAPDKVDSSGWEPPTIEEIGKTDCGCGVGYNPGIVLDPFMGSGTVAKVASRLGMDFLGIELGDEYVEMAWRRIMGIKLKNTLNVPDTCKEGNE